MKIIDELLLREWNLLLMAAVWILMAVLEHALPEHFVKGRALNRLEPVIPMGLCVFASVAIPGPWMPEGAAAAERLILGVLLGWGSYNFAGLAKRFGLNTALFRVSTPRPKP